MPNMCATHRPALRLPPFCGCAAAAYAHTQEGRPRRGACGRAREADHRGRSYGSAGHRLSTIARDRFAAARCARRALDSQSRRFITDALIATSERGGDGPRAGATPLGVDCDLTRTRHCQVMKGDRRRATGATLGLDTAHSRRQAREAAAHWPAAHYECLGRAEARVSCCSIGGVWGNASAASIMLEQRRLTKPAAGHHHHHKQQRRQRAVRRTSNWGIAYASLPTHS